MTEKVKKFLDRYFETLNGTQSAIDVGYSKKSARAQASQMLAIDSSIEYLKSLREKEAIKHDITKDKWLSELRESGFSNIQDYILEGNIIRDLSQIERNKASAIASVKKTVVEFEGGERVTTEFKLNDKLKALQDIGRHFGWFDKDNEQKAPTIAPIINIIAPDAK